MIVFKEITVVPLNDSLVELEFHGHYSQYKWEILSSTCTVCLLTLMRGPVSLAMMVSEPMLPLLAVRYGGWAAVIFFILASDPDAWASRYFFE
jgi:hypothetical protein